MNIKIGKNAHTCVNCESDFVHEQKINSHVRVVDNQFQREDYCADCWSDAPAEQTYSTWTMNYYDPQVAEQEPEEIFSPLRTIFYETVEESTRTSIAIAYLAAQLLRRQKVFRLIKETKDPDTDAALILFNDRIGNRLIEVSDPTLAHAELDTARVTLMERLRATEVAEQTPEEDGAEESESAPDNESTVNESTETIEVTEHGSTQKIAEA